MARIQNISGDDLEVPWLNRVVEADDVVEIPDEDWDAYTSQPATWSGIDAPASKKTTKKSTSKSKES